MRRALVNLAFCLLTALISMSALADPPPVPDDKRQDEKTVTAEEANADSSSLPSLRAPDDASAALGKPIGRVDVIVEGDRWKTAPVVKSVRAGEALSRETARRAMRELLDTGHFSNARAEVRVEAGAAVLELHVVPRRLVATIKMTGGDLDTDATLEAADLAENAEVTSTSLGVIKDKIRAFYKRHGFPTAAVKLDVTDTDDPDRVVLAIEITQGPPQVVTQRVFVIDPKADAEAGDLKGRYKVVRGDRLDEQALAEADRDLTDALHAAHFFRASVRHDHKEEGGRTYLYVFVQTGPRIVPTFVGNRAFDADQLTLALTLDKPTEGKPAELLDRLRAFYVARGFFDVEISVEERGGDADVVHPMVFTLYEHEQVRVVRRVFPCLPDTFSPDSMGSEIESFLEEELPGADSLWSGDPRVIGHLFGPTTGAGGRGVPVDLNPSMTYSPDVYDRALKHLRDLFYSKGYLNAVVGPISVVRATCSKKSKAGECIPEPTQARVVAKCEKDAVGLPIPEPPVPDELSCQPDPVHNVRCSNEVTLRIPLSPGPQSTLYDLAFEGNRSYPETRLARVADLTVGEPLNNLELDDARQRILDLYRNDGFAYAEVRTAIEPSPDRTRARARFLITEREKVVITDFVVKGATKTSEKLILRRLALKKDGAYKQDLARQSEERIATLGTFSSVSIGLEDVDVPQKQKRVIITVAEQVAQYTEPRIGFSTGEGVRFAFEYGHRNVGGLAIALTVRVQFNYLFDFMILDPQVKANYSQLSVGERLERRDTLSVSFPEIGLGPLIGFTVDGIDVRDNQRDFGITKEAIVPTIGYRPLKSINTQLSASGELNDVTIFTESTAGTTFQLVKAPKGRTIAVAERAVFTWDARDNAFAATKGILISTGVEHVDAFPADIADNPATDKSHFLRFTGKIAGYVRLGKTPPHGEYKGSSIAMSLSAGYNFQLTSDSRTYPDRLFFLGGVDSIRAFLADAVVPEDFAQAILRADRDAKNHVATIGDVTLRGGNIELNPRLELRLPVTSFISTGIFLDAGNLWFDATKVDLTAMRYGLGTGLRFATPIGPIALDYGINMLRRPWEDFGAFHFSIGLF